MQPSGGLLGPSPSPTSARPETDFRAYSIEDILLTDWQRGVEIISHLVKEGGLLGQHA